MREARLDGAVGLPLGMAVGTVMTLVVVATGGTGHHGLSAALMVVVVDAMAFLTTAPAVLGTAATCWALHAGFVIGRHGALALTGESAGDALLIGLNAVAAIGIAATLRVCTDMVDKTIDPRVPTIPSPRESVETAIPLVS